MRVPKKRLFRIFIAAAIIASFAISSIGSYAQAIEPGRSASAAAVSDTRLIASGIADNQDLLMLSHQAATRAIDGRIKELSQQMEEGHSTILYELQQLASAGGASEPSSTATEPRRREAADLNSRLSAFSGIDFDTAWVSGLYSLEQGLLTDLSQEKEAVTNPQLKAVVTQAIPIIRKHASQLRIMQKDLVRSIIQQKRQAALQKKRS